MALKRIYDLCKPHLCLANCEMFARISITWVLSYIENKKQSRQKRYPGNCTMILFIPIQKSPKILLRRTSLHCKVSYIFNRGFHITIFDASWHLSLYRLYKMIFLRFQSGILEMASFTINFSD